nr:uncharacterized protein LOC129388222 [Dermacentor andersoni]
MLATASTQDLSELASLADMVIEVVNPLRLVVASSLHLVGKPSGRPLTATSGRAPTPCRLFYVIGKVTGQRFLINTGAQIPVYRRLYQLGPERDVLKRIKRMPVKP